MALDLSSLKITNFRESIFSKNWWNKTVDKLQNLIGSQVKPYKSYVALLTQTGTDDPVAVVLENTIGESGWIK